MEGELSIPSFAGYFYDTNTAWYWRLYDSFTTVRKYLV